jgi:hypothetical protein
LLHERVKAALFLKRLCCAFVEVRSEREETKAVVVDGVVGRGWSLNGWGGRGRRGSKEGVDVLETLEDAVDGRAEPLITD